MNNHARAAVFAGGMAFTAAPAMAQDLKASIEQATHTFEANFNRGDAHALAELYTPEATILPPGAEAITGREGIQGFWEKAGQQMKKLRLRPISVVGLGPTAAREIGSFSGDGQR